jgi:hypothetical protein
MSIDVRAVFRKLLGMTQRVTVTRYARALESELAQLRADCARLRSENRALLNSILGIAGIPPVLTSSAELPRSQPSPQAGSNAPASTASAEEGRPLGTPVTEPVSPFVDRARGKTLAQISAPVRRRSWQQINRTLEFEAARKKPQRDANEA